jgi:glycosyltransferase involved in cell wall biosynthesis
MPVAASPGLLRVLVIFHESESLGAGTSVLRALDRLAEYGWTASGWFPARGPLLENARPSLAMALAAERPLAFSGRGWREAPGVRARLGRTPAYVKAVRTALERVRPHVVHANTLLSLPEAFVARSCGLPVVMQVHELPPEGAKRALSIRAAALAADVLVGVSEAVTRMLRQHSRSTPVLTVYNGAPEIAPAAGHPERPFTVGTVGTVSRVKGTDVFLRAAALALAERPGIRFEHVGSPSLHRDPGLDDEVAALLSAASAAGSVSMRGPQPAENVLPGWDAFVLTSRTEGFPLVTLEAMARGLPVVATAVGGVPEQVDHLESGILVSPEEPEEIASWLVRLHDDVELRSRLGAAAALRVRSLFTIERQAEGLHRAYLTALNLRFGPPVVRRRAREVR